MFVAFDKLDGFLAIHGRMQVLVAMIFEQGQDQIQIVLMVIHHEDIHIKKIFL